MIHEDALDKWTVEKMNWIEKKRMKHKWLKFLNKLEKLYSKTMKKESKFNKKKRKQFPKLEDFADKR